MVEHVDLGNLGNGDVIEDLKKSVDDINSGKTVNSSAVFDRVDMPDVAPDGDTRIVGKDSDVGMSPSLEDDKKETITTTEDDTEDVNGTPMFPTSTTTKARYRNEALVTAHQAVLQNMNSFVATKRKFGLITISDYPEVAGVKEAIINLNELLTQDVAKGDADYAFELETICLAYEKLTRCCQECITFINGKQKQSKKEISLRQMAQAMIPQCKKELGQFNLVKGMYISGEKIDGDQWTDILYSLRSEEVDQTKLRTVGAGTSNLIIRTNDDGSEDYIKIEERLREKVSKDKLVSRYIRMYMEYGGKEAQTLIKTMAKDVDIASFVENVLLAFGGGIPAEKDQIKSLIGKVYTMAGIDENAMMRYFKSEKDLLDFSLFFAKKQNEYKTAVHKAKIDREETISDRNFSSSRLADRFGLGDIMAKSETIMVKRPDGSTVRANSMEGVKGDNVIEMAKIVDGVKKLDPQKPELARFYHKEIVISGKAAKQLMDLQILDLIAGQIDRHTNNYMAFFDDSTDKILIEGIKAIDNDMAFGQTKSKEVQFGESFMTPLADTFGSISVPCISQELYDRIMTPGIDLAMRFDQLDLRSQSEINSLIERFLFVRKQISELVGQGRIIVIKDENEWETVFKERLISLKNEGLLSRNYFTHVLDLVHFANLGNFLA